MAKGTRKVDVPAERAVMAVMAVKFVIRQLSVVGKKIDCFCVCAQLSFIYADWNFICACYNSICAH